MKMWITALTAFAVVQTTGFAKEERIAKGANALGQNVLREIIKKEKEKNVFISSFSIHEAISLAYVGSTGETRRELAKLLGLDARATNATVTADWKAFRENILKADPKVVIEIANSMWGNKDNNVRFKKEFTRLNKTGHEAEVRDDLNFQTDAFITKINGWASEKTHGKITSVLAPPIHKDQLFYLVNAIYFKGVWAKEFDKKATRDGEFTKLNGDRQDVKMMSQGGSYPYYQDDNFQAVQLPFGKEKRFGLTLVLPSEKNAKGFLSSLKTADLEKVTTGLKSKKGSVVLPRFKIEYGNDKVVELLQSLGVAIAFSDGAEFDGIAEDESAKINTIIHKAVIEVNEEGAEAAAVTVVGGVRTTSVEVDIPFHFEANRPFYFEIKDNTLGVTLFSGVLHEVK